jgi:hypothetical protein
MRVAGQPLLEHLHEPRLPDSGLAAQHGHLSVPLLCLFPTLEQHGGFGFASDEGSEATDTCRVQAALRAALTGHPVQRERPVHTFEEMRSEVVSDEVPLGEAPGRVADDDGIGVGEPLDARGDVRRLPERQLLTVPRGADLAHDDEPRVDADSDGEPDAALSIEPGVQGMHGANEVESGPDRPARVVLVGVGIPEVHEDPIAEVLGDVSLEALDDPGAIRLVGANHITQIFRVEPAGERRRVGQIAEQHGQVPALGIGGTALAGGGRARRGRCVGAPDEEATVLVPGDALRVDELVGQRG